MVGGLEEIKSFLFNKKEEERERKRIEIAYFFFILRSYNS